MSRYNSTGVNPARIYIGNLPGNVRNHDVEDLFEKYGRITELDLKLPRNSGSGNGSSNDGMSFCFIQYEDARDAADAIRGRDGYRFAGQKLRVQHPIPKGAGGAGGFRDSGSGFSGRGRGPGSGPPRRSDYRLMVSNLPPSGSWQDMKDHMREAGEVIYTDVFRDGTGIVEFQHKDDMEWAAKNLNDTKFKSHEGETSYIRIKVDGGVTKLRSSPRRKSRSRSRSKSQSRSRSRSASSSSRSRSPRR